MRFALLLLPTLLSSLAISAPHKLEQIPAGEAQLIRGLAAGAAAGTKLQRDAHPKANGCFDGVKFTVNKDLDAKYRVGLFAKPGEQFPAIVRSSNGANDPDQKGGAQGFALKVILDQDPALLKRLHEIKGEKIFTTVEKKFYLTQDFIGINRSRAFFVNNAADYQLFFVAQAKAKAKYEAAIAAGKSEEEAQGEKKKTFAANFLFNEKGELIRKREAAVFALFDSIHTKNPLVEEYHSFVASAFGDDRAVKYMMAPCKYVDPDKFEIPKIPEIKPESDPAFLKEVLKHQLRTGDTCYNLYAQFYEPGFPSVEEGAGTWPLPEGAKEERKGWVLLAEILIPQKKAGGELVSEEFCENLTFTPWHTLPEHLPLGGIQRAREEIYVSVANARHENRGQKP